MPDFDRSAPVLVAVGEASGRVFGLDWPCPCDLAGAAIKTALNDSGQAAALTAVIDCVAAIRSFEDSGAAMGTGSPDNVPQSYAKAGGISAQHYIYADIGGQTPQSLVNELSGALYKGEYRAVLIASAEAIGTAKRARKAEHKLDWSAASNTPFDNRLTDFPILSRAEIRNGIVSMPLAYSVIETARRLRLGMEIPAYEAEMAELWSAFSGKSQARPHAQFAKAWTAQELMHEAGGNYALTQIYKRWMVAQDAVDLGAAIILTTAGTAQDIGIARDKMIWLSGAAEASEPPLSQRSYISGSRAQEFAVAAALDQAGIAADDLGAVDIYSCFPCAVFAAIDTMNTPERNFADYSMTGGLSFFGGPGNGYSLHAIAAMAQHLRLDSTRPAMITANGGVMSKHAAGIYSANPPKRAWQGEVAMGYVAEKVAIDEAPSGKARVLSFTCPALKGAYGTEMGCATLLLQMESGARGLAVLNEAPDVDLADMIVDVTPNEKRHIAALMP
jgi:acetyl-CoA C-acetyltransferase